MAINYLNQLKFVDVGTLAFFEQEK
jgi:hypothetical protein